MSGGHFEYKQYHITEIADDIENIIENQGKEIELNPWDAQYYPDGKFNETFSKEVEQHFKDAVFLLRKASIYTKRIDWFLSGDDSEESFIRRLNKELSELK